jgi:hypothetical protein
MKMTIEAYYSRRVLPPMLQLNQPFIQIGRNMSTR